MALLSAISAVLAILLTERDLDRHRLAGRRLCADDGGGRLLSLRGAGRSGPKHHVPRQCVHHQRDRRLAIYLFAVLPLATNFEMLALALAPGLLICGVMMTQPRTAQLGTGVALIGATMIAIQNGYSGDFAAFAYGAVSLVVPGMRALAAS